MGNIRRDEQLRIQALGAAISRRDWHAAEHAYNAIRDEFDRRPAPAPAASGGLEAVREALVAAISWIEDLPRKNASHQMLDHVLDDLRATLASPAAASGSEATGKQPLQVPTIPRAENCGRYLAECNDGRLLYLNHANEWQECPNFIAAALAASANAKVKALEWRWELVPPCGEWLASSAVGLYCARLRNRSLELRFRDTEMIGTFASTDAGLIEAKAAAQADYEARIRAALATRNNGGNDA